MRAGYPAQESLRETNSRSGALFRVWTVLLTLPIKSLSLYSGLTEHTEHLRESDD